MTACLVPLLITRSLNLNLIGAGRGELSGEFVKPAGDYQERFLSAKSSELGARSEGEWLCCARR
jgi:hypothetical protein